MMSVDHIVSDGNVYCYGSEIIYTKVELHVKV